MKWINDNVERMTRIVAIFRVLSDEGQDEIVHRACRIYMREQKITDADIESLGRRNLREVTEREVDLAFSREADLAKARSDRAFQRFIGAALKGSKRRRRK